MIIKSIRAKNILKYEELTLENLPEKGLIAISGQNESGKSTIGETLCFALFGRTFSLNEEEIEKVVRWGENHCTVTLIFEVDGKTFELSRFLGRDGSHSARLTSKSDTNIPTERGVDAVAEKIFSLIGYEFEEFVESFYLAQREITTPHPHSHAVKIMAGVAPLEYVAGEFEQEISERTDALSDLAEEILSVEEDISSLDMNEAILNDRQQVCQEISDQHEKDRELVAMLEDETNAYVQMYPEARSAARSRIINKFFRFIFFILALVCGATWGALAHGMHLPESQQLLELIQKYYPDWQSAYVLYMGFAGIGFSVLFLLLWMRVASLKGRINDFSASAAWFADLLAQARELQMSPSSDDPNQVDQGLVLSIDETPVRPEEHEFAEMHGRIFQLEATSAEARGYMDTELAWLRLVLKHQRLELDEHLRQVEDAETRLDKVNGLSEVLADLSEKQAYLESRVEMRRKAIELLDGASTYQSNNFNRDIKVLVGNTLPMFTENRYEHLQISEDLDVRVFSSLKRDFLDLDEVSSGTQRQIMLALRLALSQKLLGHAVKGKQFAFLDEPFAFFDEERTRNALAALSRFSEEITQIWIISQAFPVDSEVEFAVNLTCSRDQDVLR